MTKMLTKQQIFDKVSVYLIRQNKICENDDGCLYHGNDGLRCAIGCLIPKRYYNISMEEENVDNLFKFHKKAMIGCKLSSRYKGLLNELQMVHDDRMVMEWREELGKVARNFKVSPDKFMKAKPR